MNTKKKSTAKSPQTRKPPLRRRGARQSEIPLALVRSLVWGMGAAVALLAAFAFLLARTELPLAVVKPFVCAASGLGAAVSAIVLAGAVGRQRVLYGLGCGAFYCLCLGLATLVMRGIPVMDGANSMLLSALLLGGTVGGTFSALRAPAGARPH